MRPEKRDITDHSVPVNDEPQHLPLPHERDEGAGHVSEHLDKKVVQAKKDLDAGLIDTDTRNPPGADAPARKRLLKQTQGGPGSGADAAAGQSEE
jgi:hypothetical protein